MSIESILVLILAGLMIGAAKTGVNGLGMIAMPLVALVFGGKGASGVVLPVLIFADLFAVWYYNRHANWGMLRRLLPLAVVGILLGTWVGQQIDDDAFRALMAVIIFISLGIMIWRERAPSDQLPTSNWFASAAGLAGGFTTMVGNLAGSIMSLYLLAMRLPKNEFIGTAAWFFLIVNVIKVPFHVFVWKTIDFDSAQQSLVAFPAVAIGAYLGMIIVKRIPEQNYRYFIIVMTGITALVMLV